MKKLFAILLLSCMMPAYAEVVKVPTPPKAATSSGLYDDILGSRYKGCNSIECIDRVHAENMATLNQLERSNMYLMHEAQMQQAAPQQIQYGYNAQGNFVPVSVGGQRIHYGYNPYGEFVPKYIGN